MCTLGQSINLSGHPGSWAKSDMNSPDKTLSQDLQPTMGEEHRQKGQREGCRIVMKREWSRGQAEQSHCSGLPHGVKGHSSKSPTLYLKTSWFLGAYLPCSIANTPSPAQCSPTTGALDRLGDEQQRTECTCPPQVPGRLCQRATVENSCTG